MNRQTYYFPCYEWVYDGYLAFSSVTRLPQNEHLTVIKHHRDEYLARQRGLYTWAGREKIIVELTGHLPQKHDELRRDDQFTIERLAQNASNTAAVKSNALRTKLFSIDTVDEVTRLSLVPKLKFREHCRRCWHEWKDDGEFARQQLNGLRLVNNFYISDL